MRITLFLLVLLLTGCAGIGSEWRHIGSQSGREAITPRFAHTLPAGWTYHWPMRSETILVSRDGPAIQLAISTFHPWEKPIPGDPTLLKSQSPTDVAEQILAARRLELNVAELELVALTPEDIAGLEGFRAEYTYRTGFDVSYRGVCYGAPLSEGLYLLRLEAPVIFYFERDLPAFESMVASVRRPTPQERKRAEDGFR